MTDIAPATRGPGRRVTQDRIMEREPFRAGALRGNHVNGGVSAGQLPAEWLRVLRTEWPSYVVTSYETPIAWWSKEHGWTAPDVWYSATTNTHQHIVSVALAAL